MILVVAPTGETRINTTTANNQDQPVIASLSDGGWVVTWRSESQDGSGTGIYQQRYAANGLAIGGEILVNRTTANNQTVPKVTGLSDGGWLVVWESPDGAGSGIYQQRYNQYGLKVGPETRVNTTTASNQQDPTVTALVGGGWVVTWASEFQDGSSLGVYQQRYGANGYPVGTERLVNTVTLDTQWKPSVTALADGGWIVTWEELGTIANRFDIKQQRYDADGWTVDDETRVNIPIEGDQASSRVTALKDGGWVVTWTSFGQDGSDNGIYLQRYAVNGQKVGGEILVNTTTAGNQSASFVTALADGGWVVTWTSGSTGDATADVYQQRFAANGAKIQGERLVNTFTAGNQIATSVTALKDGSWIVAWQSMDQDGAGWGTYQQRFSTAGQAVGPTTPTGLSLSGNAVNEGATAATQIGQLVVQSYVTDPGLTYSLLDSAGGRFSLSSKGVLSVKDGVRLDYEQAVSHSILVEVKDSWGSSYKTWLSVSVRDVASESVSGSSGSDLLKGGSGRDAFKGGAGNDTLWGGLGNDTLQGDAGRDAFVFDSKPSSSANKDKIADFSVKDDAIWLDNKVFTKLGKAGSETKPAQLKKEFFTIGAKAKDKNDYVIYDDKKGVLYYDADGSGKGKAVEIATLFKNLKMTYKDFFVI